METIYEYFSHIPSSHRTFILVGGIAFFWIVESLAPLFQFKESKIKHAGINIFFTLTTILINFSLAFLLLKSSEWALQNQFGILNWLSIKSVGLQMFLGIVFLDLIGAYTAHWVEHQVKFLWGFHLVHHTDQEVDTTSANRHHPLESVVRFLFTCIATLITGAPIGIIMLYQALSVVLSQFNHANIALPSSLDRWLNWIIVTPNMHKIHHHYKVPYTDANYGNIFGIWDRIFGTYRHLAPNQVQFGLDTYPNPEENKSILKLLKTAFNPYRNPKS